VTRSGVGRDETIEFATELLELVHSASTTTSYKYALLMALIEMAAESEPGDGSLVITTRQIAMRTLELYWPQARAFHGDRRLSQLCGRGRSIVDHIAAWQAGLGEQLGSPQLARRRDTAGFEALLDEIEWLMIRHPIPLLQRIGGRSLDLLYEPSWVAELARGPVRAYQAGRASEFDNRVVLLPGVGVKLATLAPLFLPLIRREWTRFVARANQQLSDEARIEDFLFEPDREQLGRALRRELSAMQERRCFYCREPLGNRVDIDHFLAWSRCGASAIDNLVAAHPTCNNDKSDLLVASPHLDRWIDRLDHGRDDLHDIAERHNWYAEPARIGALVRANYAHLGPKTPLWVAHERWVAAADEPLDPSRLALARVLGQLGP
jgi:hypothetical protein